MECVTMLLYNFVDQGLHACQHIQYCIRLVFLAEWMIPAHVCERPPPTKHIKKPLGSRAKPDCLLTLTDYFDIFCHCEKILDSINVSLVRQVLPGAFLHVFEGLVVKKVADEVEMSDRLVKGDLVVHRCTVELGGRLLVITGQRLTQTVYNLKVFHLILSSLHSL